MAPRNVQLNPKVELFNRTRDVQFLRFGIVGLNAQGRFERRVDGPKRAQIPHGDLVSVADFVSAYLVYQLSICAVYRPA